MSTELKPVPPVARLFDAIAHGDETHRAWLRKAIEDYFAGRPVDLVAPAPVSPPAGDVASEPSKDDQQAAFERWLYRTCPSGDVTEVQRQWEASGDYAELWEDAAPADHDAYIEGGRESVEDALAVVESFGPGTAGVNDTFARQILLAEEVRRLRLMYEQAVKGRADFRNALRAERAAAPEAEPMDEDEIEMLRQTEDDFGDTG